MTGVCQGLSLLAPGGSKMRDPGNKVDLYILMESVELHLQMV